MSAFTVFLIVCVLFGALVYGLVNAPEPEKPSVTFDSEHANERLKIPKEQSPPPDIFHLQDIAPEDEVTEEFTVS